MGCCLNLSFYVIGLLSFYVDLKDLIFLEKVYIREKWLLRKCGVNRIVVCVMYGEIDDGEV